jgi:tRNA pseudouridine55 synthase
MAGASTDRPAWTRVDGVLLLDKPSGLSSNVALQRARRLFRAEKAGHTGTLDPLACGLLPLCFGEATKFAQLLLDATKRYRARIRFGVATTTGDAEGEVAATGPDTVSEDALRAALARLTGPQMQVPPRHAALKHEGRAYYDYARAGVDIPRAPRAVEVHALALVEFAPPHAVVDVACSKGTYVRVLAEDLGASLGTCAHLAALRRTGSGEFDVADAVTLDAIESTPAEARPSLLLPPDALVAALPRVDLDAAHAQALRQGRPVPCEAAAATRARAYDPSGRLLGVVERDGPRWRAQRLMRTQD